MAKIDLSSLKKPELAEGVRKSLANSKQLFEEASILFDNKRYARAFTLTQLCSEELGKARMLTGICWEIDLGEAVDYKLMNKSFVNHWDKSSAALFFELFGLLIFCKSDGVEDGKNTFEKYKEDLLQEFNETDSQDKMKNDSLYVGLSDSNHFVMPDSQFSEEQVSQFMSKVKLRLEVATQTLLAMIEESPVREKAIEIAKQKNISDSGHSINDLNFESF